MSSDFPDERRLAYMVDSFFVGLDLVRLTRQMMANRWYPQVPELDVIKSLDHFFGGVTDVTLLDDDADDDLPLTDEAIAKGQAELEAWLSSSKRSPRQRDGE